MDNREYDPNESWDEYRWERYLQENDRRCDQFAKLLEVHLHDPHRDRIIAQEMGWNHLLEAGEPVDAAGRGGLFLELIDLMLAGDELGEEAPSAQFSGDDGDFGSFPEGDLGFGTPSLFSIEDECMPGKADPFDFLNDDAPGTPPPLPHDFTNDLDDLGLSSGILDEDDEDDEEDDDLASHPLCDLAATYQAWLERLIQDEPELLLDPVAARLTAYSAICGAKVCAALEGDEFEDLGMTIAYLKRGLKAINTALEAFANLSQRAVLPPPRLEELRNRVFRIRDGIIELMGYYRMEWMRRIDE